MLAFGVELDAVATKDSWDAPVKRVSEALHKECLPHWERIRDLEAEKLVGLFGAEVHHAAGRERQAEGREGPGYIKAHKHIVVTEALQDSSTNVDCQGLLAIKVNHARRHHRFLGAAFEDGENTPESIGEDHRHHLGVFSKLFRDSAGRGRSAQHRRVRCASR